jgi:hypothetical protein
MVRIYLKEEHLSLQWHRCFYYDCWLLHPSIEKWLDSDCKCQYRTNFEKSYDEYEMEWCNTVNWYITSYNQNKDYISPLDYAKPYIEFTENTDAILFKLTWS